MAAVTAEVKKMEDEDVLVNRRLGEARSTSCWATVTPS